MAKSVKVGAGELTEQITLQSQTPVAVAVISITRAGAVGTVTTGAAHGFTTGDYVTHAGAVQTEYNGEFAVTVTGATTYTFAVTGAPATPATGTITTVYTSDSQGGVGAGWYTFAAGLFARVQALSAFEQLAAGGISAIGNYTVTINYRADVSTKMRLLWTPYLETVAKVLEIHGVQPNRDEPRRYLDLSVGEVQD